MISAMRPSMMTLVSSILGIPAWFFLFLEPLEMENLLPCWFCSEPFSERPIETSWVTISLPLLLAFYTPCHSIM